MNTLEESIKKTIMFGVISVPFFIYILYHNKPNFIMIINDTGDIALSRTKLICYSILFSLVVSIVTIIITSKTTIKPISNENVSSENVSSENNIVINNNTNFFNNNGFVPLFKTKDNQSTIL